MDTDNVVTAYVRHGKAVLCRQGASCAACAGSPRATQTRTLGQPAHGYARGDVVPLCDACARDHDQAQRVALRVVGAP